MLKKKGFTLIELLVVIAIIAVLMGVLMPALQTVKRQGYAVVCRSNMKQIGLAANMYAEDYKNKVPRGLVYDTSATWFELFMPYLAQKGTGTANSDYRTVKIYRCKAYPEKTQTVCYIINGWKFRGPTDMVGDQEGDATKIDDVKHPSKVIYLSDYEYIPGKTIIIKQAGQVGIENCDIRKVDDLAYNLKGEINPERRVPLDRHANGGNILYFDWSVGHLDAKEIVIDRFRIN